MRIWCSSSSKACQALGPGAIPGIRFCLGVIVACPAVTGRVLVQIQGAEFEGGKELM